MAASIDYLKKNPIISDVLAEGFAHIYQEKPQFPITYLANFLKNHQHLKQQKQELIKRLDDNQTLIATLKKDEEGKAKCAREEEERMKRQQQRQEGFEFRIRQSNNHQEILNVFCEWVQESKKLTGVYIGQLENQWKKIDLEAEDGVEAHLDNEAPKIIKFKAASNSHNLLMIGKTLTLESVVGKVLSEKEEAVEEGEAEGKQKAKPKGEIYIPLVQENKELTFFKYPRLGSFYALAMRVRSYLHEKIFDANIVKTETYRKAKEEYDKEQEERQNKFRALYDERSASGADEKELEELQQNYEKEEENFPKPKLEEFQFVLREFVVCFDTLGQDRELTEADRDYCKTIVEVLRSNWENKERELLQHDIDSQLKLLQENAENPQQEALARLVEEEDKELPTHEEVEKVKANEKLMELEINTLRLEKIKEYVGEEKYLASLDILLDRRVLKFPEIMKLFFLFAGFRKEEVTLRGTNVFNWLKAKALLPRDQLKQIITAYIARGSKPDVEVKPYAKWQRLLRNLEKYDLAAVATYNIFLAFLLRFLIIAGKVRIADNQARKNAARVEREVREEKLKEAEAKRVEKEEKLAAARAQAEGKEEPFDEQAWLHVYEEENPGVQVGEEVVEQADNDLEEEAPPAPA